MVDKVKQGRSNRNRGAGAERELCAMLTENLGMKFNRQLKQYQKSQEGDIEQLVGPYLIEAKYCNAANLKGWWRQASEAASKRGAIPCLAIKEKFKGWKFLVPIPSAWESGHQWGGELQFTMTLYPEGFYLLVRERG